MERQDARLPANFKQLSMEKNSITYKNVTIGQNIPVQVRSREEIEREAHRDGCPYSRPIRQVFIEYNQTRGWSLNIPNCDLTAWAITFTLLCFTLPAPLVLGTDCNAFTNRRKLSEAIINKAKSIAFFSVDPTDKRAWEAARLYEIAYRTACHEDATQAAGG